MSELIKDRVKICLEFVFGQFDYKNETLLQKDLDADEIDLMDLLFDLEEEFDIILDDDDLDNDISVSDLVKLIKRKVNEN